MNRRLLILLSAVFILASCEKKEEPVNPAKSLALTAGMGSTYDKMLYFNVSTGLFVQETEHLPYDLQFQNKAEDQHLYLNSSNFMFVKNMGVVPFASVSDTIGGSEWRYDYPTGEEHRTAFGDWMNENGASKMEVFILNRGTNTDGFPIGFVKMQILGADKDGYTMRIADLDNQNDTTLTIEKNPDNDRIQFWLQTMAVEEIEPASALWHLLFTQYTDYDITDQGDTIPYSVRGVLINPNSTSIAQLENVDFDTVILEDVQSLNYSKLRNAIGYNWKKFSIDTGIYQVVSNQVYIIKENGGNYYKLRFVDFYNDQGEKGFAKFEIVGL